MQRIKFWAAGTSTSTSWLAIGNPNRFPEKPVAFVAVGGLEVGREFSPN